MVAREFSKTCADVLLGKFTKQYVRMFDLCSRCGVRVSGGHSLANVLWGALCAIVMRVDDWAHSTPGER
jgi:hypothetical protein